MFSRKICVHYTQTIARSPCLSIFLCTIPPCPPLLLAFFRHRYPNNFRCAPKTKIPNTQCADVDDDDATSVRLPVRFTELTITLLLLCVLCVYGVCFCARCTLERATEQQTTMMAWRFLRILLVCFQKSTTQTEHTHTHTFRMSL